MRKVKFNNNELITYKKIQAEIQTFKKKFERKNLLTITPLDYVRKGFYREICSGKDAGGFNDLVTGLPSIPLTGFGDK